jgi:hypothetical protein
MPVQFQFHDAIALHYLPAPANFCRPARNIFNANGNQSFP